MVLSEESVWEADSVKQVMWLPWTNGTRISVKGVCFFIFNYFFHFYLTCVDVLLTCKSVHLLYVWCLQRPEEGSGSPGTWITDVFEPSSGWWNLNLGPLEEQLESQPFLFVNLFWYHTTQLLQGFRGKLLSFFPIKSPAISNTCKWSWSCSFAKCNGQRRSKDPFQSPDSSCRKDGEEPRRCSCLGTLTTSRF